MFGDHPLTEGVKNSVIVERAKAYYAANYPNGGDMIRRHIDFAKSDVPFANDIAQFIGSARVSIIPRGDVTYYVVDNTTSRHSGAYDNATNIPRSSNEVTPTGNIYQRFIWFE